MKKLSRVILGSIALALSLIPFRSYKYLVSDLAPMLRKVTPSSVVN